MTCQGKIKGLRLFSSRYKPESGYLIITLVPRDHNGDWGLFMLDTVQTHSQRQSLNRENRQRVGKAVLLSSILQIGTEAQTN